MANGFKTGGREKGTPNKEKKHFLELIKDKYPDYHPVISMAEIANDTDNDINLRFAANKEVAKYVTPQLKSIQYTIPDYEKTQPNFPEWFYEGDSIPIHKWLEVGNTPKPQIDYSKFTLEELQQFRDLLQRIQVEV